MKRSKFSDDEIIAILKEHEAGAMVTDLCRRHGLSRATFYAWKARRGGGEESTNRRLSEVLKENDRLKKMLADSFLENAKLKEFLERKR